MTDFTRRVRLERDQYPERPDWDAQCPVIMREAGNWGTRIHEMAGKEHLPIASFNESAGTFDSDTFERWLTIFVGPWRTLEPGYPTGDVWYEIATPAWLEHVGLTLDDVPDKVFGHTSEYEDYLQGDVFILVPEELQVWARLEGGVIPDPLSVRHEWNDDPEVHAVGGYYGREWAIEAAREEFYDPEREPFLIVDEDGSVIEEVTA